MTLIFRLSQITQSAADEPITLRLTSADNALSFTLDDAPELKALRIGDEIKVTLDLPE